MPNTVDGKVYPDSSGHTRLWEHLQALAESSSPIVCTSTARPVGYPGRRIFETDTGRELVYYDPPGATAAGWFRPWNLPWGVVAATSALVGTSGLNAYTLVMQTGNFDTFDGRSYAVTLSAALDNPVAGTTDVNLDRYNGAAFVSTIENRTYPHGPAPDNFPPVAITNTWAPGALVGARIGVNVKHDTGGFVTSFTTRGTPRLRVVDLGPTP